MNKDIKVIIIALIGLLAIYGYFKNVDEYSRNDIILNNTNQTLENNEIMTATLDKIDAMSGRLNNTTLRGVENQEKLNSTLQLIWGINNRSVTNQGLLSETVDQLLNQSNNIERLLNVTNSSIGIIQSNVLSDKLTGTANAENQRTMFSYLDNIKSELDNMTKLLTDLKKELD